MRSLLTVLFSGLLAICLMTPLAAQSRMIESFEDQPETRWRFFSDQVMGGVSTGKLTFLSEAGRSLARMTGTVSTENRGGFIQMRLDLDAPPPDGATGVVLRVRGNDQRYFVHLRTNGTVLPWQYYQAGFDVTGAWTEFRLPFSAFSASGRLLRNTPKASSVKSVAVVAYGRDHAAEIDVAEIGFY